MVGTVEEVVVEERCCIIWFSFSSLARPKKVADDEAAAIFKISLCSTACFSLFKANKSRIDKKGSAHIRGLCYLDSKSTEGLKTSSSCKK